MRRQKIRELPPRTFWKVVVVTLLIILGVFWVSIHFVKLIPPRTLKMTTGIEGGSFVVLGQRYRQVLARDGIQLQLLASSGSIENLTRLKDESKAAEVGFVQGGIGKAEVASKLVSLDSIFYSPLWVFSRGQDRLDDLSQLRGKRISIGPEGSGVRRFSLALLKAADASDPPTELFEHSMADAGKALKELEEELQANPMTEQIDGYRERLDRIEDAVSRIRVAVAFYDEIFLFQEHISLVQQKLAHSVLAVLSKPGSLPIES